MKPGIRSRVHFEGPTAARSRCSCRLLGFRHHTWMALGVGCRGGVRGATRAGRGSHADLRILGLLSQVDVHDVIRGVVDVHGLSGGRGRSVSGMELTVVLGAHRCPRHPTRPDPGQGHGPAPDPSCGASCVSPSPVRARGHRLLGHPDRPTVTARGGTGRYTGATAAARDDPWRSPHLGTPLWSGAAAMPVCQRRTRLRLLAPPTGSTPIPSSRRPARPRCPGGLRVGS
jgi:hypothetical protein